jgi:predicted flavoprotein YhiN
MNDGFGQFTVEAEDGTFTAPRLVVATGGLSIAKIGATSFGYDLARQFGLKNPASRPALVPLVFSERDRRRWCDLAGVSIDVVASMAKTAAEFPRKHAVHSSWHQRAGDSPDFFLLGRKGSRSIWISRQTATSSPSCGNRGHRDQSGWKLLLRELLPRRFADRWLEIYPLAGNSDRALREAEHQLHAWELHPDETEGYGKAEVTAGGVDTDELSAKTMEVQKVPGLFFIGEVVDVTGQLGGFNFQWAWASGFCAGQAM